MHTGNTYMANSQAVQRKWYVIDATDKPLGRLATEVAKILRGKNKPIFTPHVDTGDHVIVVNAEKVMLTGKKMVQKTYFHHTGYVGGARFVQAGKMMAEKPERVIELAVKGMLPKNRLGRAMFKKLKVYRGPAHPHAAQQPEQLELGGR